MRTHPVSELVRRLQGEAGGALCSLHFPPGLWRQGLCRGVPPGPGSTWKPPNWQTRWKRNVSVGLVSYAAATQR